MISGARHLRPGYDAAVLDPPRPAGSLLQYGEGNFAIGATDTKPSIAATLDRTANPGGCGTICSVP